MDSHLDPDTLAAYVDGRLQLDELGTADRHIDECVSCRSELSALAAVHTMPAGPEREVPEGKLGRYHVLRELGRGSMGVVLRAYDPELARPVAIKLLRDVTRDELRDEARTLARLRHPNVVAVYDVFTDELGAYLAMELVDGDTLRGFAKGRSREQILDACVRAGRGLAAAHDAGVIHRDFKPENVLCADDGEVRVSDFGLARAADATADGAIAGTPAYMAPEVLRREPATAQSDQYSYCVAVHEMLTGKRQLDVDPSLPPWIARALRRGLARDPAERFASMHELLAAITDDPRARRRRRLLLAGVAAAALATGALAVVLTRSSGPTCAVDETALGWTPVRAQELARTFGADAPPVVAALDDYASSWVAARYDACAATHERGEQSQLALDRRVACLDRRRREMGELVGLLSNADARLVRRAQDAVSRLRDPRSCTGTDEADTLPSDPVGRVVVEQARTLLDRAAVLQITAKLDEADALAARVIASLPEGESPRLLAEALLVRARVSNDRTQPDRAEELLFEALHAASRGHDDRAVAEIWIDIVMATGAQKHRFDLALSNARAADAALARIEPGELQLRYDYTLGAMLLAQGKLPDARKRLEHGLALSLRDKDPRRNGQRGLFHMTLCDVDRQAGQMPAAREHCKQAHALLEKAFGRDHMRLALLHNINGALAFADHDLATAERSYKRVIEILDLRKQSDQLTYALALSNLGAVYSSRDDVAQAFAYFERSRDKFAASYPEHPQRLMPLQGLASLALRQGDTVLAIRYYDMIRQIQTATYAPENPVLMIADYNLALAYVNHKELAKAQTVLDVMIARATTPGKEQWLYAARAFDLAAQVSDERHDYKASFALIQRAVAAIDHTDDAVERALVLRHVGEIHRHLKQPALAIEPLERAVKDLGTEPDAYDLGTTRYHLALALWESGRDKPRAVVVAKQAAADLARASTGEARKQYQAELAKFLALHE